MGRAVSVSQSLPGLRSCQSQPHGCCQRSGFAAGFPTRPATSVLGGFATSSAPAFPSSCAAATAAAAAVRGSEVDYRCAATIDKTHHLRLLSLYYSYTIGVLPISDSNTGRCQLSLCTAIPGIVDNETFFDSPLRGNFGPTSTAGSARPSLSSTHYGLQRQCSARVTRRSAAVEKPPQGRHFHLAGVIWLINVGEAAIEEPTAAAAAGQTPGKTVAIAADASTSTDFPYGQSGTGRLSFRLRRLQRNAKHPAIYDSLRSVKGKAVSRLGAFSGKIVGNCAILPLRSRMATF